jgi:hypothetical protein
MKVAAMRKAIGSLVEVVKKAAEGHGVDRHLCQGGMSPEPKDGLHAQAHGTTGSLLNIFAT